MWIAIAIVASLILGFIVGSLGTGWHIGLQIRDAISGRKDVDVDGGAKGWRQMFRQKGVTWPGDEIPNALKLVAAAILKHDAKTVSRAIDAEASR